MSKLKAAVATTPNVKVPTEVKSSLYQITRDDKEVYVGRITLGPVVLDDITAYMSTFENKEGKEIPFIQVDLPTRPSDKINPHTQKPYINRIYIPTKEASEEFYKIIRQQVKLQMGTPLKAGEELITEWKYSTQETVAVRPPHLNAKLVNDEEDTGGWVMVGDFVIAGIQVNGVFLREKKVEVDEEGNVVERDIYGDHYVRYPWRQITTKEGVEKYYDYVRPFNYDVRQETTKKFVDMAVRELNNAVA